MWCISIQSTCCSNSSVYWLRKQWSFHPEREEKKKQREQEWKEKEKVLAHKAQERAQKAVKTARKGEERAKVRAQKTAQNTEDVEKPDTRSRRPETESRKPDTRRDMLWCTSGWCWTENWVECVCRHCEKRRVNLTKLWSPQLHSCTYGTAQDLKRLHNSKLLCLCLA